MSENDEIVADVFKARRKKDAHEIWEKLGICGCGDPEAVRAWLVRVLSVLKLSDEPRPGLDATFAAFGLTKEQPELFQAVHSWLDVAGITEHGGSIYGAYLTEGGEDFLLALQELTLDEITEIPDADS